MGWFDSQIEQRKRTEIDILSESFQKISQSVVGRKIGDGGWTSEGADIKDAIAQLLKYYNVKAKEVPAKYKKLEEQLDYQLSASGIMYRNIILEKGWHNDAMGAIIATLKEEGTVITILPQHSGGYAYIDPKTARKIKVSGQVEKTIGDQAFCFYRPLPMRRLKLKDLFRYMWNCLNTWDLVSFIIAAVCITGIGMIVTKLNNLLFGPVISYDSKKLLIAVVSFMLSTIIGSTLFNIIRQMLLIRIRTKLNINVSAATMMRVLSLPVGFFKNYSSGELNEYLNYMNGLCNIMVDSLLSSGITGVFSLLYLTQIFAYARSLVVPALCVTIITLIISVTAARIQTSISKERVAITARENGLTYSLINGIQKIRLSGAENRAFAKWADLYSQEAAATFNPPAIIKLNTVLTTAVTMIGTIIIYYVAVSDNISVADYYAFNNAYAYISTAFSALASLAVSAGTIKPVLDIIKPLLEAVPESQDGRETVSSITGSLEFSHVSFRYTPEGPWIFDDLNLTIPAKQYVAIVGRTGCGKSTLMRLLMGFEEPVKGTIFIDRKDTRGLDMRSVRKQIGTVMQDGKLFGGSLFDNITISDPALTLDDAWRAAEIAGMADDIRNMPMGMNTMVQEGSGGVSGGQRQRLMIARAVAPGPKLLLLDEATSALDNITQKKVSDALDTMKCTRIVIAHRLSTIRHCDRILVLDKGKIIEDGTYEELIANNGYFAELVERQRLDNDR